MADAAAFTQASVWFGEFEIDVNHMLHSHQVPTKLNTYGR